MRRRVAVVTAALLATSGVAVTVPAGAAPAPSVSAPGTVAYYAHVTVAGTAPHDGDAVSVYFKAPGASSYTPLRHLSADAHGRWATTYYAGTDESIFARAEGVNSPARSVLVRRASCSVSAAAFAPRVAKGQLAGDGFVQFTAERGGTWAGSWYDYAGGSVDLVSWFRGTQHVLARYRYAKVPFEPESSVQPLGFAPNGALVMSMESQYSGLWAGYYWYHGARYAMSHGKYWHRWDVTGVSDNGAVVGWADSGGQSYVITWSSPGAAYHVLTRTGGYGSSPQIDGRGDVAWTSGTGHVTIRRVDGRTIYPELQVEKGGPWSSEIFTIDGASGNAFYSSFGGIQRFTVDPASNLPVVHGYPVTSSAARRLAAVGRGNALVAEVGDRPNPSRLRTAGGAYPAVPSRFNPYGYVGSRVGVDERGVVAFTSSSDRAVHFLRCS